MDTSQAIIESLTVDRFKAAVILGFKKFITFSGRSARWEYWLFVLFNFVVGLVLGAISEELNLLYSLICLLPNLALGIRRLHDVNRSGWWTLIALTGIGVFVLLYWAFLRGTEGPNRFGEDPLASGNMPAHA